jgi:hypothetical protein
VHTRLALLLTSARNYHATGFIAMNCRGRNTSRDMLLLVVSSAWCLRQRYQVCEVLSAHAACKWLRFQSFLEGLNEDINEPRMWNDQHQQTYVFAIT